jgi:addiction module HigA family antidote
MNASTNQYNPDYAVPPGWVLEEELEELGLSQAEFARRCGRSAKLISEIISGKASIEPQTAIQFDRVLGGGADIWLRLESTYRLQLARKAEAQTASESVEWARQFPIKELVERGLFTKPSLASDTVDVVLSFFGVGSVDAWQSKYSTTAVAYRHSPSFESNRTALSTWLRLGEIEAEQKECADYNEAEFRRTLIQIRTLTADITSQNIKESQRLCQESGVVLSFTKPFPGVSLSGAAWWLSPRKPVIQLSARHKTDDHLWFSLFHEAAHILLHSKKRVFIDAIRGKSDCNGPEESEAETEANQWAGDFLIPRADWDKFAGAFSGGTAGVRQFAKEQGIAPGIVVGRLQREGLLPWGSRLNSLKRKLVWTESSE